MSVPYVPMCSLECAEIGMRAHRPEEVILTSGYACSTITVAKILASPVAARPRPLRPNNRTKRRKLALEVSARR